MFLAIKKLMYMSTCLKSQNDHRYNSKNDSSLKFIL